MRCIYLFLCVLINEVKWIKLNNMANISNLVFYREREKRLN